ncbi:hypothetical protein GcM1_220051 [Golovinomyces cichoracearum]|uniref:Uncharacterized protein n=1 Tax=Golovinomyces cichoracearum TaxID=62708 RepID=A0A420IS39_9PEZI|nr:hypothetical protein GcM1_220051 [Golovinomyces cichoracearum]
MYMNSGPHFGDQTRKFAENSGSAWCNSPVAARTATGMVEKAVDIFHRVLKKLMKSPSKWPESGAQAIFEVNHREITHLLYSPAHICLDFEPTRALKTRYPAITLDRDISLEEDEHSRLVIEFIKQRNEIRRKTLGRSDRRKDLIEQQHDMGVWAYQEYSPGDLVMLFGHREAGKKLRPSWRGPFVVRGLGRDMGKSHRLTQVDGTYILRHFHRNSLNPFRLKEGYLVSEKEERLPIFQNIRLGKAIFKPPTMLRTIPGALIMDK